MFTRLSTLRLLTIFLICAVVAMWLTTACADDSREVDPEVKEKGMTDKNLDEANQPSVVIPEVKEKEANDPSKANPEAAENDMTAENTSESDKPSRVIPEAEEKDMVPENLNEANYFCGISPDDIHGDEDVVLARSIRYKYEDLFWRQPNVHSVGIGDITDENGEYTGIWGFRIHVIEKVDQNTLPPEDRIPHCLEGVPVQIVETPMMELL